MHSWEGTQDKSGEGVMVQRGDHSFWLKPQVTICEGYYQESEEQSSGREVCGASQVAQ